MISPSAVQWSRSRSFAHDDFAEKSARDRDLTVSVCVPARNEAATIAPIVGVLVGLRDRGVVDEVVVVDGGSRDETAALAAEAGAKVHQQDALCPAAGPVLGKGDAMWRALSVLRGDVVCFVDADTEVFGPHFVAGLVGPLLADEGIAFVKGCYRRPFKDSGIELPDGGGRVNELMARPLLNRFYPELGAVRQPLAGEMAARRALLESLPFFAGYGVEIGLLIDAWRTAGLMAIAEVDLGVRQNRHQPLRELGPMAAAVLAAVSRRLAESGRLADAGADSLLMPAGSGLEGREPALVERPAMRTAARGAGPPPEPGCPAPSGAR